MPQYGHTAKSCRVQGNGYLGKLWHRSWVSTRTHTFRTISPKTRLCTLCAQGWIIYLHFPVLVKSTQNSWQVYYTFPGPRSQNRNPLREKGYTCKHPGEPGHNRYGSRPLCAHNKHRISSISGRHALASGSSLLACMWERDDNDGDWGDTLAFSPPPAAFSRHFTSVQSLLFMTHRTSRLYKRVPPSVP